MSENKKPRLCEVLGISQYEVFELTETKGEFWINPSTGLPESDSFTFAECCKWICKAIAHPEIIERKHAGREV